VFEAGEEDGAEGFSGRVGEAFVRVVFGRWDSWEGFRSRCGLVVVFCCFALVGVGLVLNPSWLARVVCTAVIEAMFYQPRKLSIRVHVFQKSIELACAIGCFEPATLC